jgi:hypothetical protein
MSKKSIQISLRKIKNGKLIFLLLIGMGVKTNIIFGYLVMEKIDTDY